MNLLKNKRKLSGTLIIAMFLALIISVGVPEKAYAVEGREKGMNYYIWNTKVTADEEGNQVLSTGPVSVTRSGDVTTISLNDHVLGSLWFAEDGTYVLEANSKAIYPKGLNNAIDGNLGRVQDITLTLKGNGVYYGGLHHIIYLSGHTLNIESGSFYKSNNPGDDIDTGTTYFVRANSQSVVYVVTPNNVTGDASGYTYDVGKTLPNVPWYGVNYNMIVKQGQAPTDEELGYIVTPLNPETEYNYASNPKPDSGQGGGGNSTPSNPINPGQGGGGNSTPSNPINPGQGEGEPQLQPTPGGNTSSNGGTTDSHKGGEYVEEEPVVIVIPEGQKYVENVLEQLSVVPEDGKVVIDTKDWYCFNRTLAEKIADRKDVAVTIQYMYQGKRYEVTIPAGSDVISLLDENGFVGFRYLDAVFGGKEL